MKKNICTICGSEHCDGVEWIVPYTYENEAGTVSGVEIVCTSQTKKVGTIRMHTIITGYMIRCDFTAFNKIDLETYNKITMI